MPGIPGLRVVRSSIDGYGVIATRTFHRGERIAGIDGVLLRADDVLDDTYCLQITNEWLFDMADQTRWINHSCDPNAKIEADLEGPDGAWANIVAARPILPGEEITYDYAFVAECAEPCRCGSPYCRGLIIDPDEIPRLEELRAAALRAEPSLVEVS